MKPAKLPKSPKDVPPYTQCQVIGWGYTDQKLKKPSDVLRGVDVAIIGRDDCTSIYNGFKVITADMLCAGNKKPMNDTCTVCIKSSKESTISGY